MLNHGLVTGRITKDLELNTRNRYGTYKGF